MEIGAKILSVRATTDCTAAACAGEQVSPTGQDEGCLQDGSLAAAIGTGQHHERVGKTFGAAEIKL